MALPIDSVLPEIAARLRTEPNLVIEAPPGAGKTTRVPPALLDLDPRQVLVLEPRRIAARMAARRVASERREALGETAGFQVRFDSAGGPRTRLWFLTEGVLTRRLMGDPTLAGAGIVVLDEFHERHLEGDLALALVRRLQCTARPDLRLVVMSATLEAAPVAAYLGGCGRVRSEGRLHPLSIRYTPHSPAPLEQQVAAALENLLREGLDGSVLVFLPGAAEIRRAQRACEPAARRADLEVLPLYGDLPPEQQDWAVTPGVRPRVILSTNVAESSITIADVTAVIDSGLARAAFDSPWTGLPSLRVVPVSRASADQRAGRAGRLGPGRVIRLYPETDYLRRPPHDEPEIVRRELAQVCLDLHAMGIEDPRRLEWLTPPPEESLGAAETLLRRLGALEADGRATVMGSRMARLPLHPRLARLVVDAEERGAGREGCAAAALLSVGERLTTEAAPGPSDLIALLESRWPPQVRRVEAQIRRELRAALAAARPGRGERRRAAAGGRTDGDDPLLLAILTAFPDRVARRRRGEELLLAGGGSARLSPASVVRGADLLVAIDIEERSDQDQPLVRLASAVKQEWLFDLFPDRIAESRAVEWNRELERVEMIDRLLFEGIAIDESRSSAPDSEAATRLLAEKAWAEGLARFADEAEILAFKHRLDFAGRYARLPRLEEADIRQALERLCAGLRSFKELTEAAGNGGLLTNVKAILRPEDQRLLDKVAPERLTLPGGRRLRVHYEPGKPPWAASRLQDFFGMKESPRVGGGAVPVVLHLLAPNQRPVQTTTDLGGFWERLYPKLRSELSRRYPKHAWPRTPSL